MPKLVSGKDEGSWQVVYFPATQSPFILMLLGSHMKILRLCKSHERCLCNWQLRAVVFLFLPSITQIEFCPYLKTKRHQSKGIIMYASSERSGSSQHLLMKIVYFILYVLMGYSHHNFSPHILTMGCMYPREKQ